VMDRLEAERVALAALNANYSDLSDSLVLLEGETIEKPYGWVFFCQSRTYVETGLRSWILAGNGPVVVLHRDGSIHMLGSARPPEEEIQDFERNHRLLGT
jgi:hypothetical protein